MKATTIKLDGELLQEIEKARDPGQSVTSYVRQSLTRSLRERTLREAAAQYMAFKGGAEQEGAWLDEWDSADLASPPKEKRRSRKSPS